MGGLTNASELGAQRRAIDFLCVATQRYNMHVAKSQSLFAALRALTHLWDHP